MKPAPSPRLRAALSGVLALGVSVAAALMLAGVGAALVVGWSGSLRGAGPVEHIVGDFGQLGPGLRDLRPFAIAQLGLLVLLATPVARVATAAAAFLIQGDGLYAAISTTVLIILLTSIFLIR